VRKVEAEVLLEEVLVKLPRNLSVTNGNIDFRVALIEYYIIIFQIIGRKHHLSP